MEYIKLFIGGIFVKIYSNNIVSDIEALKVKESEREFLKAFKNSLPGKGILKITPFSGFYADLYYEHEGKNLVVKFMDTNEDTFSILEEELIEIMSEEYDYYIEETIKLGFGISTSYIFFMPYVDLSYLKDDFSNKFIIDKSRFELLKKDKSGLQHYLSEYNDEIQSNMFRYFLAREYHVIKKEDDKRIINPDFKKIVFDHRQNRYQAITLTSAQIRQINSLKYGNTLFIGPAGCGKTTTLIARLIKLSTVYSKDNFLFLTFNKQLVADIKSTMDIMGIKNDNIEIINFHSFILNIAKPYGLKIGNDTSKSFDKQFESIFNKIKQIYKEKNIYKGIIVDEAENFNQSHLEFLTNILYKTKNIFIISSDKAKDIRGFMENFTGGWENFDFADIVEFNCNFRCTKKLSSFTNNFIDNVNDYIESKEIIIPHDYYMKSESVRNSGTEIILSRFENAEEKISEIVKLIKHLKEVKGISYSDICVIYPFNKRKTNPGSTIYFQYLLRNALQQAEVPLIVAHEDITNLTYKNGVTISNIYSINNLEYKYVILCELEMLYSHSILLNSTASDHAAFIKNINIIYTAITRATDKLYIFTLMNDEDSDIINLLSEALDSKK